MTGCSITRRRRRRFEERDEREAVGWDYAPSHDSTRAYPLAPYRDELGAMKRCSERARS